MNLSHWVKYRKLYNTVENSLNWELTVMGLIPMMSLSGSTNMVPASLDGREDGIYGSEWVGAIKSPNKCDKIQIF